MHSAQSRDEMVSASQEVSHVVEDAYPELEFRS
jgi:hypothetical protein